MKSTFMILLVMAVAFPLADKGQEHPLVLAQTVSVPSMQGGFNHMSVDAVRHRLFAAAPTNTTLEVIDLQTGKPLRSLPGEKPAAARYAPEFDQLYVPRGQHLVIYDGKTLDVIKSIDLQSSLDEMQYDPQAKQLYVGCMSAEKPGIAVISIPDGTLVGVIPLPAKPQGFAVELGGDRIFANVPSVKQIAVLNRKSRTALPPWDLQAFQGNSPIAFDEASHRLFVGARNPARLVVIDTDTGKVVVGVDINKDTDDLFYDSDHRRIYVSCGEGFVDIIQQRDADHYQSIAQIPTVSGARTSTFSVRLNSLFVGVPRRGDQPAEIQVFKAGK
jgi:DNA-binding beta-propeller fold protein YncE